MDIKVIDAVQMPLYDKFVEEYGGVFNYSIWKSNVHKEKLIYYGIYEKDGQLAGVFHLYFAKKFGFTFIKNPPFIPNIGLVFNNRSVNNANNLSYVKDILEAVTAFIGTQSFSVLSIALPSSIVDTQPFFWNKYKVVPNYTYQHSLAETEAEIEKRYSVNSRNAVKKAVKDGVEVKLSNDYSIVKQMVKNTFSRREEGFDEALIDSILFKLATPQNSFAFVAYWENKPIAVSFCLFDKNVTYYCLGGYDHNSTHRGAGALCIHKSIMLAKEMGNKIFDFEGSMIPEVESYFRSFGPVMLPYYTINKAKLPFEMILKFIKREKF